MRLCNILFKLRFIIPFTALTITLFSSCKTIKVQEKSTFTVAKYNIEVVDKYIHITDLEAPEKALYINAANKIIQTKDEDVLKTSTVELKRKYFSVNDTITLEYFIVQPANATKTGFFFPGNGTNIFNYANKLFEFSVKTNTRIYILNYRGYGNSTGQPSFKTQFSDNKLFVNHIKEAEKKPVDFVIGYSLGSIFGTYAAVDNKIQHLYLLSPFSSTSHFLKYFKRQKTKGLKVVFRPFFHLNAEEYLLAISNTEKIKNYHGNLTVVHGKEDKILPFVMGDKVYKAYKSTDKKFIAVSGGHSVAFENENWNKIIESIK